MYAQSGPTPYPTLRVQGTLREYLGETACYDDVAAASLTVDLVPEEDEGVDVACTVNSPATNVYDTYECFVTFRNDEPGITVDPDQSLAVQVEYLHERQYTATGVVEAPGACIAVDDLDPTEELIDINVATVSPEVLFQRDVLLYNQRPWAKIRNAGMVLYDSTPFFNFIPRQMNLFGGGDADDENVRQIGVGPESGVFTGQELETGTADISTKGWVKEDYTSRYYDGRDLFFSYTKARREAIRIASVSEISQDGVYLLVDQADTLQSFVLDAGSAAFFGEYDVVLYVDALTVSVDVFDPVSGGGDPASTLFFANSIDFASTASYVRGIFVTQTASIVEKNPPDTQGLKIVGNFVVYEDFLNARVMSDNSYPSLFVVFDPTLYVNLLPWISTQQYEWR